MTLFPSLLTFLPCSFADFCDANSRYRGFRRFFLDWFLSILYLSILYLNVGSGMPRWFAAAFWSAVLSSATPKSVEGYCLSKKGKVNVSIKKRYHTREKGEDTAGCIDLRWCPTISKTHYQQTKHYNRDYTRLTNAIKQGKR